MGADYDMAQLDVCHDTLSSSCDRPVMIKLSRECRKGGDKGVWPGTDRQAEAPGNLQPHLIHRHPVRPYGISLALLFEVMCLRTIC